MKCGPASCLLINLAPRWVLRNGHEVGVVLRCPACEGEQGHALALFFENPIGVPAWTPDRGDPRRRWHRIGETFATLTLEPSIDTLCWQGWIRCGDVVTV